MIDMNLVIIESNLDIELIESLKTLYTTPQGTVPLDRNFGMDPSFIDENIEKSKSMYSIELLKKTKLYFPFLKVTEINFINADDTNLKAKVRVKMNEQYPC